MDDAMQRIAERMASRASKNGNWWFHAYKVDVAYLLANLEEARALQHKMAGAALVPSPRTEGT